MKSIVIVVISGPEAQARAQARILALEARGFEGRICVGPADLRETLGVLQAKAPAF